jgi:hypothetical protein
METAPLVQAPEPGQYKVTGYKLAVCWQNDGKDGKSTFSHHLETDESFEVLKTPLNTLVTIGEETYRAVLISSEGEVFKTIYEEVWEKAEMLEATEAVA